MILSPMRFKSFVWPHNPRTYTITFQRNMALHKIPFGRHVLQSLGQPRRVMRGEGEFAGEGAYDKFKELATVFYEETPGVLVHPVWMTATAWFTDLELRQQPRRDYVAYSFEFWEAVPQDGAGLTVRSLAGESGAAPAAGDGGAAWHTVVKGDTLWELSRQYGTALEQLIDLNPQISNPNRIYVGQKVRVR